MTIPFSLLMVYVYFSIFDLKIAGIYGLYPNKNTDGLSMIFFANIITKLATPLVYNFLLMIRVFDNSIFSFIMGSGDINEKLGKNFMTFYPILLVIIMILNYFNVYSKIMIKLNLEKYAYNIVIDKEDKVYEGEQLLKKARRYRERKLLVNSISF
jgi:hypothetical protein